MKTDLTEGKVTASMLVFAGPMILGNLLQQCYNLADTLIVGRFLGADALAAVGSAYTLMTFLTSILIGLCMGSGSVYSFYFGKKDEVQMRNSIAAAFVFIGAVSLGVNGVVFAALSWILKLLQVPASIWAMMEEYVFVIFFGIFFVFLYNYFAFLLRAVGNSVVPLCFLGSAALLNVGLDLLFVLYFGWGIRGAAAATVIAQIFSGVGIGVYTWLKEAWLRPRKEELVFTKRGVGEILRFSAAACIQQSVMNFGILMIQGLVNRFGTAVMAAFAAGVKIDSFAYMPAQEFGNAFSIFTSQNHGAGKKERVKAGISSAVKVSVVFCGVVSAAVFIFAPVLLQVFIDPKEREILRIGTQYLRVEGAFYFGIGVLFLLYGYFRGIGKPEMSVVLTVISLGTRVVFAYLTAPWPKVGVLGIWWAVPLGWVLADMVGLYAVWKDERGNRAK